MQSMAVETIKAKCGDILTDIETNESYYSIIGKAV